MESGYSQHVIPIEYIEQHMSNPGAKGTYVDDVREYVTVGPKPPRPFIRPAMIKSMSKLGPTIRREFVKAVRSDVRKLMSNMRWN